MNFDFSSLVFDRDQADVQAQNNKGTYNVSDLNRVTAAMEAINETLSALGYVTGFQPINIPHDAPAVVDDHTLLLIHGSAAQDSSVYAVPINNFGVSISANQSKFGGGSLYFNGDAYLNANVQVSGDFTLDFWIYPISTSIAFPTPVDYLLAGSGLRGLYLHIFPSLTSFNFQTQAGASQLFLDPIPPNTWTHFAAVTQGGTCKAYFNGVYQGEISGNSGLNSLYIGELLELLGQHITGFVGYIDEFRLSDIARWSGNFTPPDTPYSDETAQPTDPYTWYETDIPLQGQMTQYLRNMAAVRGALTLPEGTPEVPDTMEGLTWQEANAIERLLAVAAESVEILSWTPVACGSATCGGDYL